MKILDHLGREIEIEVKKLPMPKREAYTFRPRRTGPIVNLTPDFPAYKVPLGDDAGRKVVVVSGGWKRPKRKYGEPESWLGERAIVNGLGTVVEGPYTWPLTKPPRQKILPVERLFKNIDSWMPPVWLVEMDDYCQIQIHLKLKEITFVDEWPSEDQLKWENFTKPENKVPGAPPVKKATAPEGFEKLFREKYENGYPK